MVYKIYGAKGSGVASLIHILLDKGYDVQAYDQENYVYTEDELSRRNVKILPFEEIQVNNDDILIYGHTFKDDERLKNIKKQVLESYEYHEYVNKIVKESKLSIAVAGSHGKTYTTGLISFLLNKISRASYLIGDGEGKYYDNNIFVFEACEYQDHFLIYKPDISIILNIDYDHVDYFLNEKQYLESFQKFINNSKQAILNKDNLNTQKINSNNNQLYSLEEVSCLELTKEGYKFKLGQDEIETNIFGVKHLENLLAVIKLFDYLNIDRKSYIREIKKFSGVKRRFRETIINGDIYIDDYAHHPTQIQYTLEMIKNKYSDYELIVFYKPDRPSRFLTFYKQIATSLEQANYAVIMDFPSCANKNIKINLLINENPNKFYIYNQKIIKKIRRIKKKVVITFSSKNMQEVYENIFINGH